MHCPPVDALLSPPVHHSCTAHLPTCPSAPQLPCLPSAWLKHPNQPPARLPALPPQRPIAQHAAWPAAGPAICGPPPPHTPVAGWQPVQRAAAGRVGAIQGGLRMRVGKGVGSIWRGRQVGRGSVPPDAGRGVSRPAPLPGGHPRWLVSTKASTQAVEEPRLKGGATCRMGAHAVLVLSACCAPLTTPLRSCRGSPPPAGASAVPDRKLSVGPRLPSRVDPARQPRVPEPPAAERQPRLGRRAAPRPGLAQPSHAVSRLKNGLRFLSRVDERTVCISTLLLLRH